MRHLRSQHNLDEMLQYYLVLSKYPDYFYRAVTWFKYMIAAKICDGSCNR